ncbi:hypothetical protein ES708_19637 [subsurface metagenome]
MKNRIGWCSMTFNPVWGCRNNCPYCYARAMAKRFWEKMLENEFYYYYYEKEHPNWVWTGLEGEYAGIDKFRPVFLKSQFNKKLPKKPQRIFVGSMSEIYYWEKFWIEGVIKKIKLYPQHTFMFLTQHPEVYAKHLFAPNCWFGVTMIRNKPIERAICIPTKKGLKFLSIEPILEKIDIETIDDFEPNWVIVGAETGKRKGKIVPKKEWIEIIVDFCNRTGVPLYLKDSLKNIYPEEIKEFPKIN